MVVHLKVLANAKKNSICSYEGGYLKVKIAKPAIDGKANIELVKYLADFFCVKKGDVKILSGDTSNYKTIDIPISKEYLLSKLGGV